MRRDGQRLQDICCHNLDNNFVDMCYINQFKVRKGAKIRNRYIQVTHLTQDTSGKATNSQSDTTGISHSYQSDRLIFVLRIVGIYPFYSKYDRTFCKQMVEPLSDDAFCSV